MHTKVKNVGKGTTLTRQLLVDDTIEFIGCCIQQGKPANDLLTCISNKLSLALRNAWTLTSGMANSSVKAVADGPDNLAQHANSQSICKVNGNQIFGLRVFWVAWYMEVP